MTRRSLLLVGLVAYAVLGSVGGCPDENDDAAVLEGRWELIPDDTLDSQTFIEFDRDGRVERVQVYFNGGRITTSVISGSAEVIRSSVRVTTRVVAGRVVFEGDLSDDENEIIGEATVQLSLPGTLIELDSQPARLVRVD